jgi:hypothetical protein
MVPLQLLRPVERELEILVAERRRRELAGLGRERFALLG